MKKLSRPKISLRRKKEQEERKEKHSVKHYIRRYWYVFFLIAIFSVSLWLRVLPARWNELTGLDEFHSYRIADYILHNNLQVYNSQDLDMLRYSPLGVSTWDMDYVFPSYFPVFIYLFVTAIGINIDFFVFVLLLGAYVGAIACIIAFFIAKDFFKSNVAGVFAAFFVSMTVSLLTRTTGGSLEKEPVAVIFMFGAVWLFIKAYNKSSWFYGILSGVSLGLMGLAWGGVQYFYLVFAAFFGILFLGNVVLVVMDYLFSGFGKSLEHLEKFMGPSMLKAYAPMILLGTIIQGLTPHSISFTDYSIFIPFWVLAVMLVRYGVARFGLIKKEKIHYVIPVILVISVAGIFAASIFTDFFDIRLGTLVNILSLSRSVVGSTVAENAPGDWATILSTLGTGFSSGILPQLDFLSPFFALWIFMFLGLALLIYEFYRTQNWMLLFFPVWLFAGIWSVFFLVRNAFFVGPAAGIIGGFFFGWMAQKISTTKYLKGKTLRSRLNFVTIPIIVLIILLVVINVASTLTYSLSISPAICFPQYKDGTGKNPFDVVPCVTVDQNGTQVLNENGEPWYQAMDFLAQKTPKDSVVLSWWDFGYWFQMRGQRASVADGGNLGGIYLRNYELAEWYMDNPDNWSYWENWMKGYKVTHIFMDYTLPGKYGAISKIGSRGENVYGFLEFRRTAMYPKSNSTVYEYTSGPYAIWLTFDNNGALAGTPMFLISQNGKYYSKTYINKFCTTNGIVQVANETEAMPGCIAINTYLGQEGLFYVPPEIENTIFNSLMFMQGYGLPVEKVYDNGLIQIYKVNYDSQMSSQ